MKKQSGSNRGKDDISFQLSERIRKVRHKQNLTQQALAAKAGVSLKYLQALESQSPHNASVAILNKLAKGFDMPLWKLLKLDE